MTPRPINLGQNTMKTVCPTQTQWITNWHNCATGMWPHQLYRKWNTCQRQMKRAKNFECHPSNCTPTLLYNKWFGCTRDDLARPKITPLITYSRYRLWLCCLNSDFMAFMIFRHYAAGTSLDAFIPDVKEPAGNLSHRDQNKRNPHALESTLTNISSIPSWVFFLLCSHPVPDQYSPADECWSGE